MLSSVDIHNIKKDEVERTNMNAWMSQKMNLIKNYIVQQNKY